MSNGFGFGYPLGVSGAVWSPSALGSDLKLWLRPESLSNPNRIRWTEEISDGAKWVPSADLTVTPGQVDPLGGNTAFLLSPLTGATRRITGEVEGVVPGETVTCQLWVKKGPSHSSSYRLRVYDGVQSNDWSATTPPDEWTKVTGTFATNVAATSLDFRIYPDWSSGDGQIYVWHPQLEAGSTATAYKSNGATVGGIVASWPDSSGNGNDAEQASQASMPLVVANSLDGHSACLSDGVDDYLFSAITSLGATDPIEVWSVFDVDTTQGEYAMDGDDAARRLAFHANSGAMSIWAGVSLLGETASGAHLWRGFFNGASSNVWVDGGSPTSGDSGANTRPTTGIHLLGRYDHSSAHTLDGPMYEFVLTNAAISATDRTKLLAYFASKYPTLGLA